MAGSLHGLAKRNDNPLSCASNTLSPQAASPSIPCEGWWEEPGFGRQPMHQLKLRIAGGQITGSGTDIVGPFRFIGTITEGGVVAMIKRYLGQHEVEYLGTYDGEGTMFGEWRIGLFKDRWAITFKRPAKGSKSVGEDAREIG
jgi:hypothetical protein